MQFGHAADWTRSSSVMATPSCSLRSTPTTSYATITPSSITTATPGSSRSSLTASPVIVNPVQASADVHSPERLPALFPDMMSLSVPSPLAVQSSSPLPTVASSMQEELDLGPAPRGRFGWPLMYVCDMAAGFAAVRRLQDVGEDRTVAFEEVFKEKFVRSTWSDNSRVWTASGRQPNVRQSWIRAGRSKLGLWTAFVKEVKQG